MPGKYVGVKTPQFETHSFKVFSGVEAAKTFNRIRNAESFHGACCGRCKC